MPLAMLCFRSKRISVIVVSIMNFTLYCCLYYVCGFTRTSRKKKIESSSSVYIISIITENKRLVYMHNYCYLFVIIMAVFFGLPALKK